MYADQIPGGYDVLDLEAPFSPQRYIEAVTAGEQANYDILIIDSASHEWEGIGGVCDMAATREAKGKAGLHNWKQPKAEHQKFVAKLLQSKTAIIINMRAKFKTRQVKVNGKNEVVKDNYTSPIQSEDFIFEMTAHAEILLDHTIRLTKEGHPDLKTCFPKGMISIATGEAIAKWAHSGAEGPSAVEIHEEARMAARQGKDAFQTWWTNNPSKRTHAKTIITELQRLTEGEQELDADPFAGMEGEVTQTDTTAIPMDSKAMSEFVTQIEACETSDAFNAILGMHEERFKATPDSDQKQAVQNIIDKTSAELALI